MYIFFKLIKKSQKQKMKRVQWKDEYCSHFEVRLPNDDKSFY